MRTVSIMGTSGLMMFLLAFSAMAYSKENLVGYWALDEASWKGTDAEVKDSSGEGNHGTAGGGATTEEEEKFGRCGVFDGNDDFVEIPNSDSLNPSKEITVMCWVSPSQGTLENQKMIILKSFTSHADPYYQYGLLMIDKPDYPKYVGFALSIDGQLAECEAPESDFDYDNWHHLAGTYDGSEMRLYLDGKEVATNSVSGKIDTYDSSLVIGAYANLNKTSTYCFGGKVDEVVVLDVALTADEIKQVMKNGVQKTILAVDSRGKLTTSWGKIKL